MFLLMDERILCRQGIEVLSKNQLVVAKGLTDWKRFDEWRVKGWSTDEQKRERERGTGREK